MDLLSGIIASALTILFGAVITALWRTSAARITDLRHLFEEKTDNIEKELTSLKEKIKEERNEYIEGLERMEDNIEKIVSSIHQIELTQTSFITTLSDRFVTKEVCDLKRSKGDN
jgi:predicted PurR-regulated permease PerM